MFAIAWLVTASFAITDLHAAVIGTLRNVAGPVDVMRGGALPAIPAKNGEKLSSGDMVRTKTGGFAEVAYTDGTVLRISQRSRIDIGEYFAGKSPNGGEVRLARGKVQAIVDLKNVKSTGAGPKKFEVRTPNAIAGVRGTDFFVAHQQRTTSILVTSGTVYSFNPTIPGRIVTLTPGTVTTITGFSPPAPPRPASRQDLQNMQQGMTPPASGGGSSGGGASGGSAGSGGGSAGGAGGGSGGSGGGTGGTVGSGTGASGGGGVFTAPDISTLPTVTTGASGPSTVNTIATGGASQVFRENTSTQPATNTGGAGGSGGSGGGTIPIVTPSTTTTTTIPPIITPPSPPPAPPTPPTPPAPTPTTSTIGIGVNFKGLRK